MVFPTVLKMIWKNVRSYCRCHIVYGFAQHSGLHFQVQEIIKRTANIWQEHPEHILCLCPHTSHVNLGSMWQRKLGMELS